MSEAVLAALRNETVDPPVLAPRTSSLDDDDLQLALWCLYELHYRGFDDVDDGCEWDPDLIRIRIALEQVLERDLRALAADAVAADGSLEEALQEVIADDPGPSLPRFVQREATEVQFRELLVHRSIYHLKEADPHAWALPRVVGPAKVALAEILYDEYGAGNPERLHSGLFARSLDGLGLRSDDGAYLDVVPGYTLAISNAMSFIGLHRRLRGAVVGHLAAFEATSSVPNRRYSQGAARLGFPASVTDYFDEHVEADAVHEQIALRDLCGSLVHQEPELRADVLFGAAVCIRLDALAATRMMDCWSRGVSSLRPDPSRAVA